MNQHSKHQLAAPFRESLPEPIVFRVASVAADSAYPWHSHDWGEFVYSFSGVMEVDLGHSRYLAPSQYALWLPPNVEHQGLNRYEACHFSLYIAAPLSDRFPKAICAISISPLVRAMIEYLRDDAEVPPYSERRRRMLQCLVDFLEAADRIGNYLPTSTDSVLASILEALEANPGDNRSLQQIAKEAHITEKTLIRRCQKDLGMTLPEWRQRLRVVKAMDRLQRGEKVESIAYNMGYSSPSAFIAMFHRLTGTTPGGYRNVK